MTPRLRIVSRVNSFYVRNAWNNEIVAGPFTYEANARRTVIALDGTRYKVKQVSEESHGVWDTQEHRFIMCEWDISTTYLTDDPRVAEKVARSLNDKARNESRLWQFRMRYPVSGDYS